MIDLFKFVFTICSFKFLREKIVFFTYFYAKERLDKLL